MTRVHRSERARRPRPRLSDRHAVAEREYRLDAVLIALWRGALTRDDAADRLTAELGMDRCEALGEVDAFLMD